ncbi:MAG: hypothetical protein IPL84_07320 [Chitinophagaceae bacterium]|nr:hypothetical protein [Chitinophagaceae bacterium]
MKKAATILFLLFLLAQVIPMVQSIWGSDMIVMTDISEESKIDKEESTQKKDLIRHLSINLVDAFQIHTHCRTASHILPYPSFEKPVPPPDFS